jgi:hypothetical protein
MNLLQEMILMNEIVLQSKIAERAAERLKVSNEKSDRIETWASIQSILIASGNVSKILWPNKKYKSRGEKLRDLLNVNEDNPLFDRTFRNHFEHYDDRIERWFEDQPSAVYRDLAMNPSMQGFGELTFNHRGYNSSNNTLIFRGESLDLNEVLNALKELRDNCSKFVLT